jgi:ParB-like chromosome segregation protein Spo0J
MVEFPVELSRSKIGPVHTVPVATLRIAGSPRTAGEDIVHVRTLADTSTELPPIIVHRGSMRVIDGAHRLRAARLCGQQEIAVRFFDGDEHDAFVLAVSANVAHGLPLSLADRKSATTQIVASHPHWSDRMIASVAGLSAATVARIRGDRGESAPTSRIGHDGKVRPVNPLERRRLARALLLEEPTLSLREVARRVGISPETARAVRGRLRGDEPRQPAPAEPPRDPAAVVRLLRNDPALRFSAIGRDLLRLLDVRMVAVERWAAMASNVPEHCRDSVAKVALECAEIWRTFADQLERRIDTEAS